MSANSIAFKALGIALTKTMNRKGDAYLRDRTNTLVDGARGLSGIALRWKEEFRGILAKPAASRGFFRGSRLWLNPNTTSNPMQVTGNLMKSLYARATSKITGTKATIKIAYGFYKVKTNGLPEYNDYGDFLDKNHKSISGFKERAYSKLRAAVATRLSSGGFK